MTDIITVKELPGQGTLNSSGYQFTRIFRVRRNDDIIPQYSAMLAVSQQFNININTPYEVRNQAGEVVEYRNDTYCSGFDSNTITDEGGRARIVQVYYQQSDFEGSPVNGLIYEDWDTDAKERAIQVDANGKPVLNTVGDPLQQTITTEDVSAVITYTRNESTRPTFALSLMKKINATPFREFAPKTCMLYEVKPKRQSHPSFGQYFENQYVIYVNFAGWTQFVLNQGLRRRPFFRTEKGPIPIRQGGDVVTEPVLLDLAGQPLPLGAPPVFLPFENRFLGDFSILGLEGATV